MVSLELPHQNTFFFPYWNLFRNIVIVLLIRNKTEGTFKQRYTQHKLSFRNRNYSNSTELSKHIWTLKDSNTNYKIDWSILATAYSNKRKRCLLCLTEKLYCQRAAEAKRPRLRGGSIIEPREYLDVQGEKISSDPEKR